MKDETKIILKEIRYNEDGTMDILLSDGKWYLNCCLKSVEGFDVDGKFYEEDKS